VLNLRTLNCFAKMHVLSLMHDAATTDGNEVLHLKLFSRLTGNFKRVGFQSFAHKTERRRKPKWSLKIYRRPIRAGT